MSLATLLFSFQGRINRARYWWVTLAYLAISVVCLILAIAIIGLGMSSETPSTGTPVNYLFMAIFAIVFLLMMWSSFAVGVKRLHDRNQSGWWMLAFSAASIAAGLLHDAATTPGSRLILSIGEFAVTIWIIIELGCLRGTQGPNRFGADPLEVSPR